MNFREKKILMKVVVGRIVNGIQFLWSAMGKNPIIIDRPISKLKTLEMFGPQSLNQSPRPSKLR